MESTHLPTDLAADRSPHSPELNDRGHPGSTPPKRTVFYMFNTLNNHVSNMYCIYVCIRRMYVYIYICVCVRVCVWYPPLRSTLAYIYIMCVCAHVIYVSKICINSIIDLLPEQPFKTHLSNHSRNHGPPSPTLHATRCKKEVPHFGMCLEKHRMAFPPDMIWRSGDFPWLC